MKIQVEGKIIQTDVTKKGGCIVSLLTKPDGKGGQEVFKVYLSKPLAIGAEFKGFIRGDVELWFGE